MNNATIKFIGSSNLLWILSCLSEKTRKEIYRNIQNLASHVRQASRHATLKRPATGHRHCISSILYLQKTKQCSSMNPTSRYMHIQHLFTCPDTKNYYYYRLFILELDRFLGYCSRVTIVRFLQRFDCNIGNLLAMKICLKKIGNVVIETLQKTNYCHSTAVAQESIQLYLR